jgi:hypothetical protein
MTRKRLQKTKDCVSKLMGVVKFALGDYSLLGEKIKESYGQ